jgi:hypothetical protein
LRSAKQKNGPDLKIQFNTAPQNAKRLADGEAYGQSRSRAPAAARPRR